MKCLLLAGGRGDRLWPLSRKNYPKQFIEIKNKHSIFQETVARNMAFCDEFIIVTNKEYLYEIGANYIKDKYHDLNSRKESEDYQVFVSYHKFNITQDKDYDYAYMWVLSESYYVKNEHLYSGRTNSSLYKIA